MKGKRLVEEGQDEQWWYEGCERIRRLCALAPYWAMGLGGRWQVC
jgi:hypothetical protein